MERFKSKRTSGSIMARKANGLVLQENMHEKDDKSVPICSRIGCSSRVNSTMGAQIDHKAKSSDSSLRSPTNRKETIGSSSRTMSGLQGTKKASKVTGDKAITPECALSRGKAKESTISVHSENSVSREVVTEAGSSSRSTFKGINQRPDLVTRMGNSVQNARASVNMHGLRDLKSKSGSDVLSSSSDQTRKTNIFRKKNSDGESSSSSRGNKTDRSVIDVKNQSSSYGNGITMSESRRNRNFRDTSVVSSNTRRSTGNNGRTGRTTLQASQPATQADINPSRSSEVLHRTSNSYNRQISSNGRLRSLMMPDSSSEAGLSHSLMNRDGFRQVLLDLERIEHDEELAYEQIVALETNLFFQHQHRDMMLDIDNMSYEELLALEEKMGTVSTALSEESLLESLKPSIYRPTDESGGICLNKDDDVKCSICQEEYVDGDEVGTLFCKHMYHVSCVQQWLRMKNWCPICKTSVESHPFS